MNLLEEILNMHVFLCILHIVIVMAHGLVILNALGGAFFLHKYTNEY